GETLQTIHILNSQAPIKAVSAEAQQPTRSETASQRNAVAKAKSYLDYSAFSHDGLVEQLEFEKFGHDDAVYGADNCGADWSEQAAKKAASYMDYSSFSRDSLIDQLIYEGFTKEQAEYGASSVGL
ncbi:MAG: Ltp family lipoprotein, partial [Berryella intestinalis]|uniref:Ltp family lipoprotein n=1 Tax=Berryella intestinalis TaxID=1531429 RepID=UPI002A75E5A7